MKTNMREAMSMVKFSSKVLRVLMMIKKKHKSEKKNLKTTEASASFCLSLAKMDWILHLCFVYAHHQNYVLEP